MIKALLFFSLFALVEPSMGQISGMWTNYFYENPFTTFSMEVKGPVKTWTMTNWKGESRTRTFDRNGNEISDTFRGTQQTFVPIDFKVYALKLQLEKSQVKHKEANGYLEDNLFNEEGEILAHRKTSTHERVGFYNSIHHESPTYTYTEKKNELAIFKYTEFGKIEEIAFYSNSDECVKMKYIYDSNQNMIETRRHDNYDVNISVRNDDFLDTLMVLPPDSMLEFEKYYPNFWLNRHTSKNKWFYNEHNQKKEYHAYGYKPNGGSAVVSFKAEWIYDNNGLLQEEIHYDVWKDRIRKKFIFDGYGNPVKEIEIGYDGLEDRVSIVTIEYYN